VYPGIPNPGESETGKGNVKQRREGILFQKKFCTSLESPLKSPEFAVPELHRASKDLG